MLVGQPDDWLVQGPAKGGETVTSASPFVRTLGTITNHF